MSRSSTGSDVSEWGSGAFVCLQEIGAQQVQKPSMTTGANGG